MKLGQLGAFKQEKGEGRSWKGRVLFCDCKTLRRFVSSFSPQCPQCPLLTQQHTSLETPSTVYTESRGASSTSFSSGESCLVCLLRRIWRYCIPNLHKEATHSSPTENTFTLGPIVPTRSPLPAIAASETLEYLVSFYLCFRDLRDPREYKNSSQGHGDEMWVAVVRTPVIL